MLLLLVHILSVLCLCVGGAGSCTWALTWSPTSAVWLRADCGWTGTERALPSLPLQDSYQELLREHTVVVLFLTMLVGAGGNAGNQSAIKVSQQGAGSRAQGPGDRRLLRRPQLCLPIR